MAVRPAVLALRALGIGDLLTAVPALRGLRAAYPEHRLVLAAPAQLRDLVALIGAVDKLLPTARLGPIGWNAASPQVAVNLHGRGPQSIHALLALEPATLITHAHPQHPGLAGPAWDPNLHEVHRWCWLLGHHEIATDPGNLALARPNAASPAPGAVVLHPGAGFRARHWPAQRYAQVASRLTGLGLQVVVSGSAPERPLAAAIAAEAGLPPTSVLAGRTRLSELAVLVAAASLVVCGDTGVSHLATAYGTPSVVLFGPVSPQHWGPPPQRPRHRALWAGRSGDTFADHPDDGLLRISVDDVVAAAEQQLATPI